MSKSRNSASWFGHKVEPGQSVNAELVITQSYSSRDVVVPLRVMRGNEPGPTVFLTGALHGDELNGTGAIRSLISDSNFALTAGTLVLVPVLNVLGFERHSRYLPDRRDLNRCFPGNSSGSMAYRFAKVVFDALVKRCDYGIDLHTAAVRRTNYPCSRTDFTNKVGMRLAEVFGCGLILDGPGPAGSLRREATRAGCPTIVVEGGEVWKVEPSVVESMTRGVQSVLVDLGMMQGETQQIASQVKIRQAKWVRAERGGFLNMHVSPGSTVTQGQPLATNSTLVHEDQHQLLAPFDGIVIGMTTLPAVQPGEPVVHLGRLKNSKSVQRANRQTQADDVQRTAQEHLSTNVQVVEPSDVEPSDVEPSDVEPSDVEPREPS